VSWYRILIHPVVVVSLLLSLSHTKELLVVTEDELIVQGLFFEEYHAYAQSRSIFGKLYDITGKKAYLFREMNAAILSNTAILSSIKRLKKWDKAHPNSLEARRLFIPLYLSAKELTKAKNEALALLELSPHEEDLELASRSFIYSGEFEKALELLTQYYRHTYHEEILLRMSMIMDNYTNQRKKALQLLETHRRMYESSETLYTQLITLYTKEGDVKSVIESYKALYTLTKEEKHLYRLIDLFWSQRDLNGAIGYLENLEEGKEILYELYKTKKDFENAYLLSDRLYQKSHDAKWLAEKAIMLFEKSEDKNSQKMLQQLSDYFKKAIAHGVDDSLYLNYYGYTLIDKDMNIAEGISMVQKALQQQPDNSYYLDSLAWGYYKQGKCKKAYTTMERVVEIEGLEIEEVKEHWQAIQKCQ
jgi:tetratricopeptide (TPR) repeat protein